MAPPVSRTGDAWHALSYLYLAGAIGFAMTRDFMFQEAWASVLLPIMIGEYVLAFAVGFALRAREVSGENAAAVDVSVKALVGMAIFMSPFFWFVVSGLWNSAPAMALGYVGTVLARIWAAASAPPQERSLIQRRFAWPVWCLICTAPLYGLYWMVGGRMPIAAGAIYFGLLFAAESYSFFRR